MNKYLLIVIVSLLFPLKDVASAKTHGKTINELNLDNKETDWEHRLQKNIKKAWNSDNYDLYIPMNTWHNRLAYDRDKIDEYNEMPWGLGLGKSFYDDEGDWHSVYAMIFDDSNYHPQSIFGYAYQHNWYFGCGQEWRIGAGYTLSLTQRHEYNYVPLPLPLPLAGIGYKNIDIQAAYVPGVKNNGNVLFTWLRWNLGN